MKKHILYAIPLFASCLVACSDWDDHFSNADNGGAGSNKSLWQMIDENPQLTDFAEVLQETKVFRQHKKTSVSYAELLDGGQSFTVVAPLNGSFDKNSLLQMVQTAEGDSVVEKSFVFNHLSRSLSSVTAEEKRVLLLNAKYANYENGKIEGVTMVTPNQRAKNGMLHVSESPIPYERNLYEMLCDKDELAPIGALLRSYEEDYFDADQSISSGVVEGVPVYVDSVIIERNKMLDALGYINREDSLYLVAAPTKDKWNSLWEETSKYFMYDNKVNKRDSLQQRFTMLALMQDAVFNVTLNPWYETAKAEGTLSSLDSMVSVPYYRPSSYLKPVYHVFHKPFAADGVLANAREIECSNGIIYEMDEWNYDPLKTFFHEIWMESEYETYITEYKSCYYNSRRLAVDSISEAGYLQILPEKATSQWEMTFKISSALSANYDICAIVLPRTVVFPDETFKPCKFKATINYVDENGTPQSFNCNNTDFITDPARIDTVVLAENFHFPACTYALQDVKTTVKLKCTITATQSTKYSREMYLDCIYLRPRTDVVSEE
ncbi:MAG: hypothetical protein IKA75_10955 [Bacteroidaceae bacterium]|nr:hypothetical protein [Bacteroidaceae bacterium]